MKATFVKEEVDMEEVELEEEDEEEYEEDFTEMPSGLFQVRA